MNDVIAYKINKKVGDKKCSICTEAFGPFIPSNFPVKIDYVDRATFDNLARELHDLKNLVTSKIGIVEKFSTTTENNEYEEEISKLHNENKILKRDIESKEEFINKLLERICDNTNLTGDKCNQTNFDKNIPNDNFQHVKTLHHEKI